MRNLLTPILVLALLGLSLLPVRADATLTLTLTGAGAANTSVAFSYVDADGARILAAARRAYPTKTVAAVLAPTDPKCVAPAPVDGVVQPFTPDPGCFPTTVATTAKEAITNMLSDLIGTIGPNTTVSDRIAAGKTASDAVTAIAPK